VTTCTVLVLDIGELNDTLRKDDISLRCPYSPPQSFGHLSGEGGESKKEPENYTSTLTVPVYILKDGAYEPLRACLVTTVPFRSPIQMALFLPFQNGEKVVFTAETVVQRNGTVVAKQALSNYH